MKNLVTVLALFVGLSTVAFAAGPSIEPGPETELKVSAELLSLLSDARVANQPQREVLRGHRAHGRVGRGTHDHVMSRRTS